MGRIGMSQRELRRVEVLARVKSKELKVVDAASLVGVSYRQGKRLWKRYREEGAQGLRHRGAGGVSARAKPARFRRRVLKLVREKYGEGERERFGATLGGGTFGQRRRDADRCRDVAEAEAENYHRQAPSAMQLREIFHLESERIIGNGWAVRYGNRLFQVQAQSRKYAPAQGQVVVCEWQDGTVEIEYRGRKLPWKEIFGTAPRVLAEPKPSPLFRVAACAAP